MPIVVLISGNGSNLQALIDSQARGELPVEIRVVISNRSDAYGLVRARKAGIETIVLSHRDFPSREAYDAKLMELIDARQPELVVLAGFMRILSERFVNHYLGRLINIHPSLLPAFRGLDTHERALRAGVKEHGCSVHFVTPELDAGPIIIQARVPVLDGDTPSTLAARVQTQEHRIYPLAVKWIAEGRIQMRDDGVYKDGIRQESPPVLEADTVATES
ncbi:MAG: phosphoribosylglycinamide formyltransferase [Xanthomonadaceae bacterium]|nr:phosphoribosylglycinamide formyltransferase [Xanthomonadaceae bacterium]